MISGAVVFGVDALGFFELVFRPGEVRHDQAVRRADRCVAGVGSRNRASTLPRDLLPHGLWDLLGQRGIVRFQFPVQGQQRRQSVSAAVRTVIFMRRAYGPVSDRGPSGP